MSFMLFYTDFVGEVLYEGVPSAVPGSVPRQRYEEGQFFVTSILDMCFILRGEMLFFKLSASPSRAHVGQRTLTKG